MRIGAVARLGFGEPSLSVLPKPTGFGLALTRGFAEAPLAVPAVARKTASEETTSARRTFAMLPRAGVTPG
jgi:hypothetical protein